MEEEIKKIAKETLESLEKSEKLPFPLYYKEVFIQIASQKGIIENLNPKLLCIPPSLNEIFLSHVEASINEVENVSENIKSSSKEIIEEIEEVPAEELKDIVKNFSITLIDKISHLEEKIKSLETELDRVYKELLVDPLTKAYNRKALKKDLRKILEKGKEKDLDLAIAIVDLDDFKKINDTYGHIVGDFVLIKLVQIIKSLIRKEDKIYRYGGDEFIIVFNRIDLYKVEKTIKRILDKIRKTKLKYKDHLIDIRISIGVTNHKKGDTLEDLIKRADECLYKIKNENKNGYCIN